MSRYLDVGVAQIQGWLARTPKLKGRRGASTMIREASGHDAINNLLSPYGGIAEINPEQGPIDGVVSLRMRTADETEGDKIERVVLAHLRAQLPAATLTVTRFDADNYHQGKDTAGPPHTWPAAVHEWPLARPCDWCHAAPASGLGGSEREGLCLDCLARADKAGMARATTPGEMPGPEHDLLERLTDQTRAVPDEFGDLAKLALGPAGDHTHVATIYADGNQLGQYIARVRENASSLLATLPATIHTATWLAVLAGLAAIDTGQQTVPIIAHLVGGDDILVTVPAHGAWDFVAAMALAFQRELHGVDERIAQAPTLSAGVVIHHHDYPLAATVELAGDLLREAKQAHPGVATLRWHSITHEGPRSTHRPATVVDTLIRQKHQLAELATLPASQRHQLAWLMRTRTAGDRDLDRQLDRMGLRAVTEPFLDSSGVLLRDALDLVRWWRA